MGTERQTICFELLQKSRARLESRLTNWVKVAISASLMYFAPELFFADTSTLSLFSSNRNRKQLNIGRIFPFMSIFSRFDIYWLPTSKSQQRLHSFLTSHVMHMKAFVTFVSAGLDGTTRLSVHF